MWPILSTVFVKRRHFQTNALFVRSQEAWVLCAHRRCVALVILWRLGCSLIASGKIVIYMQILWRSLFAEWCRKHGVVGKTFVLNSMVHDAMCKSSHGDLVCLCRIPSGRYLRQVSLKPLHSRTNSYICTYKEGNRNLFQFSYGACCNQSKSAILHASWMLIFSARPTVSEVGQWKSGLASFKSEFIGLPRVQIYMMECRKNGLFSILLTLN